MTLGQILKNKRTELDKTIEQISTATRIHVKALQALEEDRYSDLPARAFTRGFIITYCKTLQMDPDEILKSYHDFLESKFAERPEKDRGHQGYAFESSENDQKNRSMIIIASVAAFFAILTLLFFKPQNHKHREKHKELIAEEAEMAAAEAELKAATEALQAANSPGANATPQANTTPVIPEGPTTSIAPAVSPAAAAPLVAIKTIDSPSTATPPTASPTATPTTTQATLAGLSAVPSPSPKEDLMNKGDTISAENVGVKLNFQATEDVVIRYQSDQRPMFGLNLRKDKQLVIKGSNSIRFETSHPERLKWKVSSKNKPSSGYQELKQTRMEVKSDGTQTPLSAWTN